MNVKRNVFEMKQIERNVFQSSVVVLFLMFVDKFIFMLFNE